MGARARERLPRPLCDPLLLAGGEAGEQVRPLLPGGLRSPATYSAEAAWVEQADTTTGTAIQSVLDAARADNKDAAHTAISAFQSPSETTLPTYIKIGLRACGQFHP